MARISEAEKQLTPIYFQTRRESKFTIPNIALPEPNPHDYIPPLEVEVAMVRPNPGKASDW